MPFFTQGFKANPGLKLANAFSVGFLEFAIAFSVIFLELPNTFSVGFLLDLASRMGQVRGVGLMRPTIARLQRNLTPSLPGALRPLPKTTGNLNRQTIAQLTSEHDNLPAMMTFMRDEIG